MLKDNAYQTINMLGEGTQREKIKTIRQTIIMLIYVHGCLPCDLYSLLPYPVRSIRTVITRMERDGLVKRSSVKKQGKTRRALVFVDEKIIWERYSKEIFSSYRGRYALLTKQNASDYLHREAARSEHIHLLIECAIFFYCAGAATYWEQREELMERKNLRPFAFYEAFQVKGLLDPSAKKHSGSRIAGLYSTESTLYSVYNISGKVRGFTQRIEKDLRDSIENNIRVSFGVQRDCEAIILYNSQFADGIYTRIIAGSEKQSPKAPIPGGYESVYMIPCDHTGHLILRMMRVPSWKEIIIGAFLDAAEIKSGRFLKGIDGYAQETRLATLIYCVPDAKKLIEFIKYCRSPFHQGENGRIFCFQEQYEVLNKIIDESLDVEFCIVPIEEMEAIFSKRGGEI